MKSIKILIVENDLGLQQTFKYLLEASGYLCDAVAFLESAMQSLKLFDYDLILSAIEMPDGAGIELKNESKKLNKYIPIIFITACKISENLLKTTKGKSLVTYLSKPVSDEALRVAVKSALELAFYLNAPKEIPAISEIEVVDGQIFKNNVSLKKISLNRTVTMGRLSTDSYCDYQIPSKNASRHHATLVRVFKDVLISKSKDAFVLWDGEINGQKSANGCKINGKKITCQELKHGDIILLPGLTLEYFSENVVEIDANATLL